MILGRKCYRCPMRLMCLLWREPSEPVSEAAILILSKEIGKDEEEYHHNETALHLLDRDCKVEAIPTEIHDAHSYDDFSTAFLAICNETRKRYPDKMF